MFKRIDVDKILSCYGYIRQLLPFLIKRPLGYFLYITKRCNLSCDYCWQRKLPDRGIRGIKDRQNELSAREWVEVIKTIPRFSFIGISGGEPLLHPGFKDIIRFLGGRFAYSVNTNGILLDDELIENLIKYKVTNISISIDGFANIHDITRKCPGLFEHIVERIERFNTIKRRMGLKKRPSLTIKTVMVEPLLEQLKEFYHFCEKRLKAECLNIALMKTGNHAQYDFCTYNNIKEIKNLGEPICYQYGQVEKISEALSNLAGYSKKRHCKVLLSPRMVQKSAIEHLLLNQGKGIFGSCYIPWAMNVILADGTIIPCLSAKIANIRDLDYQVRQIDKLEKYQRFLKWRNIMNNSWKSPPECNMCCFNLVRE